jgi:hypothetical protein
VTARLLRLTAKASHRERRLEELRAARPAEALARAEEQLDDAIALGSLELAGHAFSWDEVRAARSGGGHHAIHALRRAQAAVPAGAALDLGALLAWGRALGAAGFRTTPRTRAEGPPPAPPEFVEGRLRIVEQWLGAPSADELQPAQAAALALARIAEIAPFDDGNGRVARLAASHVMRRRGARPPVLVGADRPRLEAALGAAFRLDTEPLATLLEEASGRALDVLVQALEREA